MSAEEPSDAKTPPAPPSDASGYRTLTPPGTPPSKPAAARAAPKSPPPDAGAEKIPPAKPDTAKKESQPDPTRFGDWEVKGRCIDF